MPESSMQGSLFSSLAEAGEFDRSFSGLERTDLGQGAWLDRQPGWVSAPDELFVKVLEALDWREGVERIRGVEVPRPRLVASFGGAETPPGLEGIGEMSTSLSERYGVALERITCNLYRDGRDSVAWHGDRIARNRPEATVAILSLGAPRTFRIRPKGGGPSIGWPAGHGDLIVMGGSCQRTHDHSIPKVSKAGQRIAVMFRHRYD
ncbi:MAG TPA: alpha-ketoglutarate-dependent dioxygenase AlkB [Acidimicrobiia bacterium]|nr:alpha-ketoglutarate-dependent dioxygenase AlkB [Acidimicrobiia bacterium]